MFNQFMSDFSGFYKAKLPEVNAVECAPAPIPSKTTAAGALCTQHTQNRFCNTTLQSMCETSTCWLTSVVGQRRQRINTGSSPIWRAWSRLGGPLSRHPHQYCNVYHSPLSHIDMEMTDTLHLVNFFFFFYPPFLDKQPSFILPIWHPLPFFVKALSCSWMICLILNEVGFLKEKMDQWHFTSSLPLERFVSTLKIKNTNCGIGSLFHKDHLCP